MLPAAVPDYRRFHFSSRSFSMENFLDRPHNAVICAEQRAGIRIEEVCVRACERLSKFRSELSAMEMLLAQVLQGWFVQGPYVACFL